MSFRRHGRGVLLGRVGGGDHVRHLEHRPAETHLGLDAPEAGMADGNRPFAFGIESLFRAVAIGARALAAQFIQAVAFAVAFIAEGCGEAAAVEMAAPLALVVDQGAVGEFRAIFLSRAGTPYIR